MQMLRLKCCGNVVGNLGSEILARMWEISCSAGRSGRFIRSRRSAVG